MKKSTIKNLLTGLSLVAVGAVANAQGLEHVTVEKYYVSNANDASESIGTLPVGSVTYRVFVDMLPGYKFQALYGVPGHDLSITTSTTFFNNEDRGATTPNGIGQQYMNDNSVAIDSWFSVGAACSTQIGVPKAADNGSTNLITAAPANTMLLNNDPSAMPALTVQDGMMVGASEAVTFVGIPSTDLDVFDATSQVGSSFFTNNGSIASLNGSVGPDAATNKVLVGQFTTDGLFCFHLNIQIGTPTPGVSENYVAMNNVGNEILFSELNFCSNTIAVKEPETPTSSVAIYPNPATDILTIEIASSEKVNANSYRLYDMIGNVIETKEIGMISGKHSEKVDISSLSKGMYFMEITMNGVQTVKKIVKE